MTYELVITEKPSAALKIAYALSDSKPVKKSNRGVSYYLLSHNKKDLVIVPAVGHLFNVAEKKDNGFKYPSFEIEWAPTSQIDKRNSYSKKYADTIKELSKDAESYTVACDYDVEGEVIGLNCIRFLCKQKDANRMKFSTLTKPDLISSYEHKSSTLNWGQANAGETRHFLDWLYGINISRALTLAIKKKGKQTTLSTGRVQGPALKLIVDKEKEIKAFEVKPYWQLELKGKINDEEITAVHEKEQFFEEKEADEIIEKTKDNNGKVSTVEKNEKTHIPPYAFDLTTLQIEAYRSLGISPKQTLAIAQSLYIGGYISYPRTSSQKLPPTIGYKRIIESLQQNDDYSKICDEILSKEKIYPRQGAKDDPAHPAIFPTGVLVKKPKTNEKKVYDLIVRRFLSAFGDPAKRIHTILKIDVEEEIFIAEGKLTIEKGWYTYYGKHLKTKETRLPETETGTLVDVESIEKLEKETKPPRRYSPASIIKELEKRNLGTKSTRAHIIDTLYRRDFIKGGWLEATDLGIGVVNTLLHHSPKIVDEELTIHFEEEMQEIREEKKTKEEVIEEAKGVLTEILDKFKKDEDKIGSKLLQAQKETEEKETLGACPNCGEGKLMVKRSKFGRFVACDKYPDCKTTYNIPKTGFIEPSGEKCSECKVPTVFVKFKGRKKQEICVNPKCPSKENSENEGEEKPCPECKEGMLKLRSSMYGQFYGCSNYPKCKHTEKINNNNKKKE
ncbi:MAG: DNA topoisomerase I [Nanoarchaeota archaeon]|nr:DNA topoisomerase I [DPANN group archaeon]MBL7116767.1 DNA topoisomerase I [Nanoarchaeota archaeon]